MVSPRRVVVTGVGLAAGTGMGVEALLGAAREGRSALRALDGRLALVGPRRGARLDLPSKDFGRWFDTKVLRLATMTRQTTLGCLAAGDALQRAGLPPDGQVHPRRGAYLGSSIVPPDFAKQAKAARILSHRPPGEDRGFVLDDARLAEAMKMASAFDFLRALPNMPSSHLSIQAGYQGPACTYLGSDASGLQAIAFAARAIEDGLADVMLGGGAFFPFQEVHLLWQGQRGLWAERDGEVLPYGLGRSGALPGEGAAMFVLEAEDHAVERGARILGEVVGHGQRFATPGEAAEPEVMAGALKAAFPEGAPTWVVPTGLGHHALDVLEAKAYALAFGDALSTSAARTVTEWIGYCGPASGPLQLALGLLAASTDLPPASRVADGACDPLASACAREGRTTGDRTVLASSSSLDGVHAAVALAVR